MPNNILFTRHGILRFYQRYHNYDHKNTKQIKEFLLSLINQSLIVYQEPNNTNVFIGANFKIVLDSKNRLVTFIV
jgi:hypothetical protein